MAKTRRRKHDQDESTAHLEPHVFTDQAEAEAAAEAHAQEQARCDVWEYDPEGRPVGWVVRVERRLVSYYLHEDGGFIR